MQDPTRVPAGPDQEQDGRHGDHRRRDAPTRTTNTLTTNQGTFTVSSGGGYTLSSASSFTDSAGTLTVTGAMTQNGGTFTQSGGTESGNPVHVAGGATLADSAGGGAFDVIGSSSLSGTIPAGQTVNVDGSGTSVVAERQRPR